MSLKDGNSIPIYQNTQAWQQLNACTRQPEGSSAERSQTQLSQAVQQIIQEVQTGGDEALRSILSRLGDPILPGVSSFQLMSNEVIRCCARVSDENKNLLESAAQNIRQFAQAFVQTLKPIRLEQAGWTAGLDWQPVERVACYVPGGRYPLPSTALMTAITAQAAGVPEIFLFSPKLTPEVVYAGQLAGVQAFYQLGGAQAVAAAAFGTPSIPAVDMLVGPGNAYVTEAKRQLQGLIGIDMLAGPSEVAIIADETANPAWVATDLLAQLEHDPDARAYLFTPSASLAVAVQQALSTQWAVLNLPSFIAQALANSGIYVLSSLAECVSASNHIAPEHLELLVAEPQTLKPMLKHYGALFMGHDLCVPMGDYMAGPNHTLPTNRTARFASGLSPLTFLRTQTWVRATNEQPEGFRQMTEQTQQFAQLEGLLAHAASATCRLSGYE